ncbi:MAG: hypothetical protein IIA48_05675 [Bacteroidetes bacterium]|nr:hypothetical protein [Bacteroidota bacterium]
MNSLQSLLQDNTSGSVELTLKLNQILKETKNKEDIENILYKVETHLKDFASINNYIFNIRNLLSDNKIKNLRKYFDSYEEQIIKQQKIIFKNAKPYIDNYKTFLTLSNSYTILQLLKRLNEIKKINVVVCESRPKLEGRILAQKLSDEKVITNLITDSAMSIFIPQVEAVILGADKILNNGNIINKTGSFSAAIISQYYNKPIYVIADKSKYVKKVKQGNNVEEKKNTWNVDINNTSDKIIYFEEVPAKLITKIITD